VRCQVLQDKHTHAGLFKEQQSVGQGDLQESLKVKGEKGQTEKHAQKNHKEDAQD